MQPDIVRLDIPALRAVTTPALHPERYTHACEIYFTIAASFCKCLRADTDGLELKVCLVVNNGLSFMTIRSSVTTRQFVAGVVTFVGPEDNARGAPG